MNPLGIDGLLLRFDILLLIFLRMLGLFITAPGLSTRVVPVQLRVAVSFTMAVILLPFLKETPSFSSVVLIVPVALQEIMVGLIIGFVASLALSALQLAGQMMDTSMGISIMNVLDPTTNAQVPLIGNLLYIVSLLVFFSISGHHILLRAAVDSYTLVPLGQAALTGPAVDAMMAMAGRLFELGLKIAAPVLAALFLTSIALGILNRAMPQMNVFVVGMPLQFAMGVFVLVLALPLYISFLQVIFRRMSDDVLTILRLIGG